MCNVEGISDDEVPVPKAPVSHRGPDSQLSYISYSHQGGESTVQNIINMKIINMDLGAGRAHPEIMRNPWLVMLYLHIWAHIYY